MPLKDTVYHVSRYLPIVRHSTAPFNFVMCLTLPYSGQTLGLVLVFSADAIPSPISAGASDDSADDEVLPPFDLNLARYAALLPVTAPCYLRVKHVLELRTC